MGRLVNELVVFVKALFELNDASVPINVVIVVEKFGSSPNAVASSFNVSKVEGAELMRLDIALLTYD